MSAQTQDLWAEIWHLHRAGVPNTRIAAKLGLHRNTIRNYLKKKSPDSEPVEAKDARHPTETQGGSRLEDTSPDPKPQE